MNRASCRPALLHCFAVRIRLCRLNQFANAPRVVFGVTVARQRIRTSGGFDQYVRPDDAGLDVDGRHLGDADADFVAAKPRPLCRIIAWSVTLMIVGKRKFPRVNRLA